MPCDFCPTKDAPGRWSQLTIVTGAERTVKVACPDCTVAMLKAADTRIEEAEQAELVERVQNILRGSKLSPAAAAKIADLAASGFTSPTQIAKTLVTRPNTIGYRG